MTPFDIRPGGYSYAEAQAFLEAIGEHGRRYYAVPELILDALYPPLYAVSRGICALAISCSDVALARRVSAW